MSATPTFAGDMKKERVPRIVAAARMRHVFAYAPSLREIFEAVSGLFTDAYARRTRRVAALHDAAPARSAIRDRSRATYNPSAAIDIDRGWFYADSPGNRRFDSDELILEFVRRRNQSTQIDMLNEGVSYASEFAKFDHKKIRPAVPVFNSGFVGAGQKSSPADLTQHPAARDRDSDAYMCIYGGRVSQVLSACEARCGLIDASSRFDEASGQ